MSPSAHLPVINNSVESSSPVWLVGYETCVYISKVRKNSENLECEGAHALTSPECSDHLREAYPCIYRNLLDVQAKGKNPMKRKKRWLVHPRAGSNREFLDKAGGIKSAWQSNERVLWTFREITSLSLSVPSQFVPSFFYRDLITIPGEEHEAEHQWAERLYSRWCMQPINTRTSIMSLRYIPFYYHHYLLLTRIPLKISLHALFFLSEFFEALSW